MRYVFDTMHTVDVYALGLWSTRYASYDTGTSGAGWHLRQTLRITSQLCPL